MQIFLAFFTNINKSWWKVYRLPVSFWNDKKILDVFFIRCKILILEKNPILLESSVYGLENFAGMYWIQASEWESWDNDFDTIWRKSLQARLSIQMKNFRMVIIVFFEAFISILLYLTACQYGSIFLFCENCTSHNAISSSELDYIAYSLPINIGKHTRYQKWRWW